MLRQVVFASAIVGSLVFSEGVSSAAAESGRQVVVDSVMLNLRSGPDNKSGVVAEMPQGTRLVVTGAASEDWLPVVVFLGGSMKKGWVNGKLVRDGASSAASAPSATPVPPQSPPVQPVVTPRVLSALAYADPLSITGSDLNCREDYMGGGYERCDVEVTVAYDGHRDVQGDFTVDCEVDARLEHKGDLFSPSRTFRESGNLYVSYGHGTASMTVSVRPSFSMEPLIQVALRDVRCSYSR